MAGEEDVCFASDSGARRRSGAKPHQDVSPERKGSKKTFSERKALVTKQGDTKWTTKNYAQYW